MGRNTATEKARNIIKSLFTPEKVFNDVLLIAPEFDQMNFGEREDYRKQLAGASGQYWYQPSHIDDSGESFD